MREVREHVDAIKTEDRCEHARLVRRRCISVLEMEQQLSYLQEQVAAMADQVQRLTMESQRLRAAAALVESPIGPGIQRRDVDAIIALTNLIERTQEMARNLCSSTVVFKAGQSEVDRWNTSMLASSVSSFFW